MRGKAFLRQCRNRCIGITPAYAGKSVVPQQGRQSPQDHPRVCGEKCGTPARAAEPPGSPPRMRGKARLRRGPRITPGITPAYAGKSLLLAAGIFWLQDHPRVCGEKLYTPCIIAPNVGSPPRMRGKEDRKEPLCGSFGITPAYAGKSAGLAPGQPRAGDHPRVCGEKWHDFVSSNTRLGSPPRMRGKD